MGFIDKMAKEVIVRPFLKYVEKEVKAEEKRYNAMMNQVSLNLELENEYKSQHGKTYEVHQQFDPIIHEHDFW